MLSPPTSGQQSWRVFHIWWKLGMVTNYSAVNYLRLLWSDYDCSVRDTHLFISFAWWDFFFFFGVGGRRGDSTDLCTWNVALEAKPDEKLDASPLYCKSFSTTNPNSFYYLCFFFVYHHICAGSRTSDMLTMVALLSTCRQPFPRSSAPDFNSSL